jgi:hypothetical protein
MADERKAGAGTWSRDRKSTPALGLPSPESTAKSVRRLRANIARTGELCGSVERLVLEGGYDARSRAVMEDLGGPLRRAGEYRRRHRPRAAPTDEAVAGVPIAALAMNKQRVTHALGFLLTAFLLGLTDYLKTSTWALAPAVGAIVTALLVDLRKVFGGGPPSPARRRRAARRVPVVRLVRLLVDQADAHHAERARRRIRRRQRPVRPSSTAPRTTCTRRVLRWWPTS